VGVEVVHHQHHGRGVGVVHVQQFLDLAGPVDPGPLGNEWTRRHPARGSTHTKIEHVPQRTYSLSSRASWLGLAPIGSRGRGIWGR
jgi:hypothetical protein